MIDIAIARVIQWGSSTHATVRISSGSVTTQMEPVLGELVPVTGYHRSRLLRELFFNFPGDKTAEEIVANAKAEIKRLRIGSGHELIPEQRDA